jgi:hypothetical protein
MEKYRHSENPNQHPSRVCDTKCYRNSEKYKDTAKTLTNIHNVCAAQTGTGTVNNVKTTAKTLTNINHKYQHTVLQLPEI